MEEGREYMSDAEGRAEHVEKTGASRPSLADYHEDDLLEVPEVARILRVSQTTVLREMRTGRLAYVQIGQRRKFVRTADLREYLQAQRVSSSNEGGGES